MGIFDIESNLKKAWDDTKGAFSGKNTKDPLPRLGALLSPSNMALEGIFGKSPMDLSFKVPDKVNANIASDIWGNKHGEGNWLTNKTATDIGGLITGGMFGAGLYGGGAAAGGAGELGVGGLPAVNVGPTLSAVPANFGASAAPAAAPAASPAASSGFDWQQMMKSSGGMGALGGGGQQEQQQMAQAQPIGPYESGQAAPSYSYSGVFDQPQQPQQGTWTQRLMSGLNSPQGQLGLRILANNQGGRSFGNVIGISGLQQQEADAQAQQAQLQRRVMEAQLRRAEQPEQASGPASVQEYQFARQNGFKGSFQDWVTAGGQTSRPSAVQEWEFFSGLSDKDKKLYLEMKRNPNMTVRDVNQVPTVIAPSNIGTSVQPLSTQESESAARERMAAAQAGGTERGRSAAEAQVDLPRQEMNAEQASQVIDELLAAPGAPRIFGMQGALPVIPGTTRADARELLDQIKGKTFLEAYNTLKGGGQITEVEGAKAEKAIARLGTAQSWEAAKRALKDLKEVIDAGVKRARKKAGAEAGGSKVIDFGDLP